MNMEGNIFFFQVRELSNLVNEFTYVAIILIQLVVYSNKTNNYSH